MQISDRIRLSDLHGRVAKSNLSESDKMFLTEMLGRFNMVIQDLIYQLKSQPTIFTCNPATNPDKVEGAKAGDIAVYKNDQGDVEISQW